MTKLKGYRCNRCNNQVEKRSDVFRIRKWKDEECFDLCPNCVEKIYSDLIKWREQREKYKYC